LTISSASIQLFGQNVLGLHRRCSMSW